MKYLLNIYESLRCLHIYKYLQVHYKVTTKFLWYIHIYGITMSLCGYYNLYNIFQSLLMQRQHHQRTGLEMFCILSPWYYIICNSIGDNSASASMCVLSPGLPSPSHLQPYLHCPRVGPGWVEAFSAGPEPGPQGRATLSLALAQGQADPGPGSGQGRPWPVDIK